MYIIMRSRGKLGSESRWMHSSDSVVLREGGGRGEKDFDWSVATRFIVQATGWVV